MVLHYVNNNVQYYCKHDDVNIADECMVNYSIAVQFTTQCSFLYITRHHGKLNVI